MQQNNGKEFADRLRALIAEQPLTKKALAERAGMHPVTLSKYLSGKRIPATEELHNLASILKVTTSHLLTGDDSKPANLEQVERLSDGSRVCDDEVPYGSKPFYLGEILKLAESADLSSILDTMETLSQSAAAGNRDASATIAQMIPIVRKRIDALPKQNQSQ